MCNVFFSASLVNLTKTLPYEQLDVTTFYKDASILSIGIGWISSDLSGFWARAYDVTDADMALAML